MYLLNTHVRVVKTGQTGYTRTDAIKVSGKTLYRVELDDTGETETFNAKDLRAILEEPEPRKPIKGAPGPESVIKLLRF